MLVDKAHWVRRTVLDMVYHSKKGHIGGSLSCVDVLVALYYHVMSEEDWFILSKGHAAASLYAVLADKGFFPLDELEGFAQEGSMLEGHPNSGIAGVRVTTGSLGHGLGIGAGVALATDNRVFVLLGDGECQEGSIWEAAMFAAHHKLTNLISIIDRNGCGATGYIEDSVNLEPLAYKWRAFGWEVREVKGHDFDDILWALSNHRENHSPLCVIAHTVKGKGVPFMEGDPMWHHRIPTEEEYRAAIT